MANDRNWALHADLRLLGLAVLRPLQVAGLSLLILLTLGLNMTTVAHDWLAWIAVCVLVFSRWMNAGDWFHRLQRLFDQTFAKLHSCWMRSPWFMFGGSEQLEFVRLQDLRKHVVVGTLGLNWLSVQATKLNSLRSVQHRPRMLRLF